MMPSDAALRALVLEELAFDPAVDPARIAVTAHDGVVTLSGQVPTLPQKVAAKEAAARVKGVRAVVQELVVLIPQDAASDEELAGRVVKVLAWSSALPREGIVAEVDRGVVTLTGEVEWDYQRRIAEQEVRRLMGVLDVRNDLTLAFRHGPADLKGRIEEALARNALDAGGVRVAADGADVVLTGSARSWFDADLAERLAWSVPGVRSVDNRLVIQDVSADEA